MNQLEAFALWKGNTDSVMLNTKLSYRKFTYDRFMKERILPISMH